MSRSKRLAGSQADPASNEIRCWAKGIFLIALGAWVWGPGLSQAEASSEKSPRSAPTPNRADPSVDQGLSPSLRMALEHDGNVERGERAYTSCAVCHGKDGSGYSDGTFPQLGGQHSSVIIKQLIDIRQGRRTNPLMLPYAKRLSGAQEIADVALYVSLLPRSTQNDKGTGQALALGAELYRRDCAACHGIDGEGDAARFIPALVGQHYGYMLRQIRDIGAGRRGNAHPAMVSLAARYSDAELMALVDHASRLRNEEPDE